MKEEITEAIANSCGHILLDVDFLEKNNISLKEALEMIDKYGLVLHKPEPSLQEAVEVLCKALREDEEEEDKIYHFTEHSSDKNSKNIYVAKSRLEEKHKNLLVGQVYKLFLDLPLELKKDFLNLLIKE